MGKQQHALLSACDKTDLEILATSLIDLGFSLIASGGTADYLVQNGFAPAAGGFPHLDLIYIEMFPTIDAARKPEVNWESILKMVDIDGPTMINLAAKSGQIVLCDKSQWQPTIDWLKNGQPDKEEYLRGLAIMAYYATGEYYSSAGRYLAMVQFSH